MPSATGTVPDPHQNQPNNHPAPHEQTIPLDNEPPHMAARVRCMRAVRTAGCVWSLELASVVGV
jgi:hypothetical protein